MIWLLEMDKFPGHRDSWTQKKKSYSKRKKKKGLDLRNLDCNHYL